MRRATILLLLVAGAAALSCAGPAKRQSIYTERDKGHDEISAYWMQIRGWRADIGLTGIEPEYHLIRRYANVSIHTLENELATMCEQPAEPAKECSDVCGLADAICDNAEAICRIADELGEDPWAKQKCASAKASCKEAKQKCCGCEEKQREQSAATAADTAADTAAAE